MAASEQITTWAHFCDVTNKIEQLEGESCLHCGKDKPDVTMRLPWAHKCHQGDHMANLTSDECLACGKHRPVIYDPDVHGDRVAEITSFMRGNGHAKLIDLPTVDLPPKPSLRDWKFISDEQSTGKIVGICNYRDTIIVATEFGVYRLEEDVLKPLKFEVKP